MSNNNFILRPAEQLTKNWGWFLFLGILMVVVGFICCIALPFATAVVVFFIGFMLLFSGILQVVQAFYAKGWGGFFLWLLAGLLYIAAGIISLFQPILAAMVFTFVLAFLLIISGVFRLIVGFQNKGINGWGWIVAAGALSALLGIIVITSWPASSLWILGLFFAIDLMFQGWSWIAIGTGLKALKK